MFLNLSNSSRLVALTTLFTIFYSGGAIARSESQPIVPQQIPELLSQFPEGNLSHQTDSSTLSQPIAEPLILARTFSGQASWYGPGFHGRLTANGEVYNQNALTAAHRTLKFGTKVKVTNLNNGRSVVVRINDRGPFIKGRVIDLSAAAARSINMIQSGVAPVKVTILGR